MEKYVIGCIIVVIVAAMIFVATQFIGGGDSTRHELPILNGTEAPVVLTENNSAKDPSLSTLLEFLANDTTETHPTIKYQYMCADYARQLHDDAEAAGIRAGIVSIHLPTTYHAVDYFVVNGTKVIVDDSQGSDRYGYAEVGKQYMTANVTDIGAEPYYTGSYDNEYGIISEIVYY